MNKLRELQKRCGKTREEVAQAVGIKKANYDNYLNGRNEPDIETLMKLARFFNVSLDEICEYDKYNKSSKIKIFNEDINKCYNLLISMTDEQVKLTYAYMLGLTEQDI